MLLKVAVYSNFFLLQMVKCLCKIISDITGHKIKKQKQRRSAHYLLLISCILT